MCSRCRRPADAAMTLVPKAPCRAALGGPRPVPASPRLVRSCRRPAPFTRRRSQPAGRARSSQASQISLYFQGTAAGRLSDKRDSIWGTKTSRSLLPPRRLANFKRIQLLGCPHLAHTPRPPQGGRHTKSRQRRARHEGGGKSVSGRHAFCTVPAILSRPRYPHGALR